MDKKSEDSKAGAKKMKVPEHISADALSIAYGAAAEHLIGVVEEFHAAYESSKKKHIDEARCLKKDIKKAIKEQKEHYGRGVVDAQKKAQETITKARIKNRQLTVEVLSATDTVKALKEDLKMAKDNYALKLESHAETLRNIKTVLGPLKGKSTKKDILNAMKKVLEYC